MQSVGIYGNSISINLLSERYQGQENANTAMLGALVTHSTLIAWFENAMRVWKVQYNSHSFTVSNAHRHSASNMCVIHFEVTGALPTQCPDAKKNIYIYICMHSHTRIQFFLRPHESHFNAQALFRKQSVESPVQLPLILCDRCSSKFVASGTWKVQYNSRRFFVFSAVSLSLL